MKLKLTVLLIGLSLNTFAANQCDRMTTEPKISAWAFEAMMAIHNYNFVNYKQIQDKASVYFTRSAWDTYKKTYEESKTQDIVIAKKLVSSAGLYGSPLFLGQGNNKWQVQVPLIVIYQSSSEHEEFREVVNLTIIKDPSVPDCLKITKMVSKPATKNNS